MNRKTNQPNSSMRWQRKGPQQPPRTTYTRERIYDVLEIKGLNTNNRGTGQPYHPTNPNLYCLKKAVTDWNYFRVVAVTVEVVDRTSRANNSMLMVGLSDASTKTPATYQVFEKVSRLPTLCGLGTSCGQGCVKISRRIPHGGKWFSTKVIVDPVNTCVPFDFIASQMGVAAINTTTASMTIAVSAVVEFKDRPLSATGPVYYMPAPYLEEDSEAIVRYDVPVPGIDADARESRGSSVFLPRLGLNISRTMNTSIPLSVSWPTNDQSSNFQGLPSYIKYHPTSAYNDINFIDPNILFASSEYYLDLQFQLYTFKSFTLNNVTHPSAIRFAGLGGNPSDNHTVGYSSLEVTIVDHDGKRLFYRKCPLGDRSIGSGSVQLDGTFYVKLRYTFTGDDNNELRAEFRNKLFMYTPLGFWTTTPNSLLFSQPEQTFHVSGDTHDAIPWLPEFIAKTDGNEDKLNTFNGAYIKETDYMSNSLWFEPVINYPGFLNSYNFPDRDSNNKYTLTTKVSFRATHPIKIATWKPVGEVRAWHKDPADNDVRVVRPDWTTLRMVKLTGRAQKQQVFVEARGGNRELQSIDMTLDAGDVVTMLYSYTLTHVSQVRDVWWYVKWSGNHFSTPLGAFALLPCVDKEVSKPANDKDNDGYGYIVPIIPPTSEVNTGFLDSETVLHDTGEEVPVSAIREDMYIPASGGS